MLYLFIFILTINILYLFHNTFPFIYIMIHTKNDLFFYLNFYNDYTYTQYIKIIYLNLIHVNYINYLYLLFVNIMLFIIYNNIKFLFYIENNNSLDVTVNIYLFIYLSIIFIYNASYILIYIILIYIELNMHILIYILFNPIEYVLFILLSSHMEMIGIEPTTHACNAHILPLNYIPKKNK